MATISREDQYTLHAYVCGRSCVRHTSYLGTITYQSMFNNCPQDCRYAVASFFDPSVFKPRVVVFDMNSTLRAPDCITVIPGPPIEFFDTVDAAIMATALLYEDP